jgi:RNA polymerase sigma-70 factor (ECF subfamily)
MATSTFPISLLDSTRIPALGSKPPQLHVNGRQADALTRAQAGDQDAFSELYAQHKKHVFSICIRMLRDFSLAEDMTQETFLQVHRKLATFRGDSVFSTWLHRLAVNTVLMHLRKRVLAVVSLDQLMEDVPEERAGRCFGARDLTQAGVIDRLAIDRAVAAMAPGYRSVFLLHDVHGFDHGEIASMLKCSCGNTKSQLHKARRVLRSNLSAPIPPVPLNRLTRSVDEVRDVLPPRVPAGGPRKSLTLPLRGRPLRPQLAVSALAT